MGKLLNDIAKHDDKMCEQDKREAEVESVAEYLMGKVESEIGFYSRVSLGNFDMTRADINALCSTDEFNDVFYAIAEKLIK